MAWSDYQKASECVPHNWIEKSIGLTGVNNKINFYRLLMEKQKTVLQLKTDVELMQSKPIKTNRRIFQSDSLSQLLFCIVLTP
jgi:hypothetical protein